MRPSVPGEAAAGVVESRTVRSLGVAGPGRPALVSYEQEPPGPGEFRVDTLFSGLSAGTELTFVRGTNPYLHARYDADLGVFRPGEPSQRYPVRVLGYMEVGRVVETRSGIIATGQLVAMSYGHRTGHVVAADRHFHVVLPESLHPLLGI